MVKFYRKIRLLFVCSSNLDRSPTAVEIFKDSRLYDAKSCGILPHCEVEVSKELIDWADIIYCMEDEHKLFILQKFKAFDKKLVVLNIPNTFMRNDPELERILRVKLNQCG